MKRMGRLWEWESQKRQGVDIISSMDAPVPSSKITLATGQANFMGH